MQKHLGLLGAAALAGVVTVLVGALFDVDRTQWWQVAPCIVVGVVVAIEVRGWQRRRHAPPARVVGPDELPDDVRRTIDAHLADRKPIAAVRAYRQATGAGLVDAKRVIDGWPEA